MQILWLTVLHFLTEGFSALAMLSRFSGGLILHGQFYYHFAALALPLVFGTALDLLTEKRKNAGQSELPLPALVAVAGLLLVLIGGVTHPFVLGLGNALFKTGGVTAVLLRDREKHARGALVGIFLAPPAIALFAGKYFGATLSDGSYLLVFGLAWIPAIALSVLVLLSARKEIRYRQSEAYQKEVQEYSEHEFEFRFGAQKKLTGKAVLALVLCFAAVLLRSFFNGAISYSWSESMILVWIAAAVMSLGVLLGGLFAARSSFTMGILFTLGPAAFLLWFKDTPVLGIMGLFLFNMSLPVTLYMVSNRLKDMPGLSAGLLSFAGFLGVLPAYFGFRAPFSDHILAALTAGLMLVFLFLALVLLVSEHKKAK